MTTPQKGRPDCRTRFQCRGGFADGCDALRFVHDDTEDRHGEERRRHGQPEHETDIATRSRHDQYRQQRSTESESFDEAKGRGTGVQGRYQKYRQQTVDHLGGDVHEEADKTQPPDRGWQAAEAATGWSTLHGMRGESTSTRLALSSSWRWSSMKLCSSVTTSA